MGRVTAATTVSNIFDSEQSLTCDALVDTGTSHLVLPNVWRDRFGQLEVLATAEVETANQARTTGEICGPVRIHVEGFRAVFDEVLFIEMQPNEGAYEPLLGYTVLEKIPASVDMIHHRLVPGKILPLKGAQTR